MKASSYLRLFFVSAAVLTLLQACREKSQKQIRDEAVKILIYNDGRVVINGDSVEPGEYKVVIENAILPDSEIWYWREDPYGIPKGSGVEVSAAMTRLTLYYPTKLFEDESLTGDYVLITDGEWANP